MVPETQLDPGAPATAIAAPTPTPAPAPHGRASTRRWLALLGVLGLGFALYCARSLLVPIVFSFLVSIVLSPAVRVLAQARVPRVLAALVVISTVLCLVAGLTTVLAGPAQEWVARAPLAVNRIENRIKELRQPLKAATDATQTLIALGQDSSKGATRVVAAEPSPVLSVLKQAPALLTSIIASVFLTFLLLISGDDLMRKLVTLVPKLSAKKDLVAGKREMQVELSRYLLTVSLINVGLGLATALALFLLGVSDPLLWAGLVAVMNFAPYLGPAITAFVLLVVGFAEFPGLAQALAVPGAFLMLHALEGQLVTPMLVGRRLALDPVVIFLALMLFGWMWGFAGLLLAVPMLACMRIIAQRMPGGDVWVRILSSNGEESRASTARATKVEENAGAAAGPEAVAGALASAPPSK